ncbi:spermatogenesis [Desmophyllum pertusum]|uniref:Spermatogenesis n=1 Tax=Desmophyllum pertusum TaxID=174260 RepID=A0A9W9ZST8_9CNID|nr:spermatogenesis [Desmophyllum pertusum]
MNETLTFRNARRYDNEKRADLEAADGVSQKLKSFATENCQDLALQRASLEGKEEFASVLEDRKSLQIRLQAVETRLREEVLKARETKPTAVSLVDELRRNKRELESQLLKLQNAYDEKHGNLHEALEQLKKSSVAIKNLKRKLSLVEGEICQREETVSALQTEMDSLKRLLDEAKEQNEEFKKENMALNADIARLVDAKEWLQKHLGFAQDARTKLQLEASEFESTFAAKNLLIEQLRCEGARSSQQLTELQQSSLMEKRRF